VSNNTYTLDIDLLSLTNGSHAIKFIATNLVGGTTTVTRDVTIDNNRIVVANIKPVDGSYLRGSFNISASISNPDTITNVQLSIDTLLQTNQFTVGNYNTTVDTLDSIPDGSHTFTVTAFDSAYNRSKTVNYMIDNTAPLAFITNVNDNDRLDDLATISFDVSDNMGIDNWTVNIGGNEVGRVADPVIKSIQTDTTSLLEGLHDLSLVASDKAGNITTDARSIFVDRTPPTLVFDNLISATTGAYNIYNDTVIFDVNSSDNLGVRLLIVEIDYRKVLGGTMFTKELYRGLPTSTVNIAFNALPGNADDIFFLDGLYPIRAIATDNAGLITTLTDNIDVEVIPPVVYMEITSKSCVVMGIGHNCTGSFIITASDSSRDLLSIDLQPVYSTYILTESRPIKSPNTLTVTGTFSSIYSISDTIINVIVNNMGNLTTDVVCNITGLTPVAPQLCTKKCSDTDVYCGTNWQ